MNRTTLLLIVLNSMIMIYVFNSVPYIWVLTILFSSILYGALSPLISARKIYFLAAEAPHISLLSIALGIILTNILPILNEFSWTILISLTLIHGIGLAIKRGLDPDIVTSAAIAFSASCSVIAVSYVLSRYSIRYNLWSIMLGDPLLTTMEDLYILISISVIVLYVTIYIYRVNVYLGIDADYVKLHGVNTLFYDLALFTVIGIASIILLKLIGFVLEHVLLLLPSIMAINITESSNQVFVISILLSVFISMTGLAISIHLNVAPAGSIGLIAFLFYTTSHILRAKKSG